MHRIMPTLLMAALLAGGCTHSSFYKSGHASTADKVGSVHLSVLSVTPWEVARAELQPKFAIDSASALAAAIPSTQAADERLFDAFSAALKVATPTLSRSSTVTRTLGDGEVERSRTDTATRSTGDVSKVGTPSFPGGGLAGLPGAPDSWTATGTDPMLAHLAATALEQEVRLLNRYVRDAAVWKGSQAFVVRLQVSVLPSKRDLPYDTITDLSFFPNDIEAQVGLGQPSGAPLGTCAAGKFDRIAATPMLVTDNLEGLLRSRSQQSVRQMGLALLTMLQGVGADVNVGRTSERLDRILGRDLNSLLTVARVSDHQVRVRLGAAQNTLSRFAMLPRTHNISLLVMYRPCEGRKIDSIAQESVISAVAKTTFMNSRTGTPVPADDYTEHFDRQVDHLNARYHVDFGGHNYLEMYQHASKGDWAGFDMALDKAWTETMKKPKPGAKNVLKMVSPGLWVELMALRASGEYSFTAIPLSLRSVAPTLPSTAQLAMVSAGDTGASVLLPQGQSLQSAELAALLTHGGTTVAARSAEWLPAQSSVRLTFPPLKPLGIEKGDKPSITLNAVLPDNRTPLSAVYSGQVVDAEKETPAVPKFTVTLPSPVIVAQADGTGRLAVAVAPNKDGKFERPVYLAVSGANIDGVQSVRGAPLVGSGEGWMIGAAGEASLLLRNLASGQAVALSLRDSDGKVLAQVGTAQAVPMAPLPRP